MKPWLTIIALSIATFLVIAGCQQPSNESFQRSVFSFGTHIDVTLYGIQQSKADAAIVKIEEQLDVMHNQWHAWRKSSLTKLNEQLVSGKPFRADQNILPLLIESQQLYYKTKGLYNPAIGKLIQLWGFYQDNPENNTDIPPKDKIQYLLDSNPNMSQISINNDIVQGFNHDLQLDWGGYAKGYGVDRLVEQLKAQGINNALINAGGDLRAIGSPGERAWTIAIQHPQKTKALGWIELSGDESVFSSGNYRRNFKNAGKIYHHIIDPRTGYPSNNATAVTVIHNNGAVADAAATALMVANPEEWFDIAKNIGLKHFLVIDKDGQLYSDQSLTLRLNLTDESMTIKVLGTLPDA